MVRASTVNNRICIQMPGFEVPDWLTTIAVDGVEYKSSNALFIVTRPDPLAFEFNFKEIGLVWSFECEEIDGKGRLIVESVLHNNSQKDLALGVACLLNTSPVTELAKPDSDTVYLGLDGVCYERLVFPIDHEEIKRNSTIKGQFFSRAASLAVQIGFTSFNRLDARITHEYSPSEGITNVKAFCDYQGWVLKTGQSTPLETFTLAVGNNPYTQLEDWADLAVQKCEPRKWEESPIGYLGGSWVDCMNVEHYEETVIRNLEAINRRMPGFGFGYVWVSIANLKDGYPGDWLSWDYDRFPSGPRGFIDRLAGYGFKLGFWCAPFWICSILTDKMEEFKDAFLDDPDGNMLVARDEWEFGAGGLMPKSERPVCYALDPTHPKVLAYLKKVFETYKEWGIRYYMADFLECGTGNIGRLPYKDHFDKSIVAGPESYHTALKVIREAAGDETYILSSTGPTVHNLGFADGIRTGTDFGEGRPITPDSYFYPGSYVINSAAFWTGPLAALRNQASAYYTHRKLYINDSGNVLTVDKPLPLSDAQIHATIHAMAGGPSMVGDDIDRMDDERLGLIKKTLPRSKEVAFPVDLFDSVMPGYPRIYQRKIEKPWGRFDIVTVYNFDEDMLNIHIPFEKFGLDADATYHVWEFWDCRYTGIATGGLQASVPPGTVRVYRITKDTGEPVIIGSDMHICMGEMEIDDCQYDSESMTLSVSTNRPAGEKGNIFIHVPENMCVVNPKGLWVTKDGRYNSLVIRSSMSFDDGTANCTVQIQPIKSSLDLAKVEP